MQGKPYLLSYDVGTTGMKTCLFSTDGHVHLVGSSLRTYPLLLLPNGGAEQRPDDWYQAMVATTKEILDTTHIDPSDIKGISFCCQMQGLVLVDKEGRAIRNAFSYLDQRATQQLREGMAHGLQIAGANIYKLLVSLACTGAVATSVKDPVWKYHWVRKREPSLFKQVYKWLDVKEYLIARITGSFIMSEDSAFATLLYNPKKHRWSKRMCSMFKVDPAHLSTIVQATDMVGVVKEPICHELGLHTGTPVFAGGGDAAIIGLGAGAVLPGESHIYMGTSGWLSTVVEKSMVDPASRTAAIVSAIPGLYAYFSELETAGKCLEWVKDHLALDEINLYLEKKLVTDTPEAIAKNLYEYMASVIDTTIPGSKGLIFAPWLHGNRCPFEDNNARGMFFNISLETGKTEMIRAVSEGVCYHMRWFLEVQEKRVKTLPIIKFVGGGALSEITCQILSDVLDRPVQTIENPQNVGALGSAIVAGLGLGLYRSVQEATDAIPKGNIYEPRQAVKEVYDRNYAVYKKLYKSNKKLFKALNA
ncbi:MAG: FGGY-family carbohydrate kinase [Sphaerochaeta sp.]